MKEQYTPISLVNFLPHCDNASGGSSALPFTTYDPRHFHLTQFGGVTQLALGGILLAAEFDEKGTVVSDYFGGKRPDELPTKAKVDFIYYDDDSATVRNVYLDYQSDLRTIFLFSQDPNGDFPIPAWGRVYDDAGWHIELADDNERGFVKSFVIFDDPFAAQSSNSGDSYDFYYDLTSNSGSVDQDSIQITGDSAIQLYRALHNGGKIVLWDKSTEKIYHAAPLTVYREIGRYDTGDPIYEQWSNVVMNYTRLVDEKSAEAVTPTSGTLKNIYFQVFVMQKGSAGELGAYFQLSWRTIRQYW